MEWTALPPSCFYFGWEPKAVVGLMESPAAVAVPTPFEIREESLGQPGGELRFLKICTSLPLDPQTLPSLAEGLRERPATGEPFFLVPTSASEIPTVARNWRSLLGPADHPPDEETHEFYLSFEVGDDWHTFPRFLAGELAFWEAIRWFRPSPDADYNVARVREARDLGQLIITHSFEGGRRSYGVAVTALCDLIARSMVKEKRMFLEALLSP